MNNTLSLAEFWLQFSHSPLFALILTLLAFYIGNELYLKSGRNPLVNPVAIAVISVASAITFLDIPYDTYFSGAGVIHFLLGTATVSLAVPIYLGFDKLRGKMIPIFAAIMAGSAVSIISAVGTARLLGASDDIVGSLYAKSVTAPISMGIAERIHVSPTLTAVSTIITGILGAILAKYVLNACRVPDMWMRGIALGTASHGIGAARAFSVNQQAGAFASLAMGLHGIYMAIMLPLAYNFFYG